MADERDERLALLGAAVVAVRSITPAYLAIGGLDTETTQEGIKLAWESAEEAIVALREFADRCAALIPN